MTIEEQLRDLPLNLPMPRLPDGSIDWRLVGTPIGDWWPSPEGWKYIPGSISGDMPLWAWIDQNKPFLWIAGGALLLIVLLGGRRR